MTISLTVLLGFSEPLISIVLSSCEWEVHKDFWAVHSEEIRVKVSTKLVLDIQEYWKMRGSEMTQWKQIQWPWQVASCIYTLTFWEDALDSKQPGKCSLWSCWFQKINISHSATWYGEMWDGAHFFFFDLLCGILIPQPEIKLAPLQWKHRVLTTWPPGKPLELEVVTTQLWAMWHLKPSRVGEISDLPCPLLPLSDCLWSTWSWKVSEGIWNSMKILSCCCQVRGIGFSTKASRWGYRCRISPFKWKLRAMYIFMPMVLCFMPLQP